jgi:branched-chain amino acid transport system ATP-binding protein
MIGTEHIYKSFDGVTVLEDLSLSVPQGAVYGLVGPNGGGENHTHPELTGIYRPDPAPSTIGGERFMKPKPKRACLYPDGLLLPAGLHPRYDAFYRG